VAADENLFQSALNRANGIVAHEQAQAAQDASVRSSEAAFEAAQHERMRVFLVEYFIRLDAARQQQIVFRTTTVRRVKGEHRVDINRGKHTGHVVGFHGYSGSDYANHPHFLRRLLLNADGGLWKIGRMSAGGMSSQTVTVGQLVAPAGNDPYYSHVRDLDGFTCLFALDYRRRTTDARYAAALVDPADDHGIPWVWEHSPHPLH
jgi:hypothetical protein